MIPDPDVIPVTIPEAEPIEIAVAAVLHVPPVTVFVSIIVDPAHTAAEPAMDAGTVLTVTFFVAAHPATV